MKLSDAQHKEAAARLVDAERQVRPIVQLAETYPGMDVDDS